MTDEEMIKYVENNGKLFSIISIETIRDGGTVTIFTNKTPFYVHKDNKTIHMEYYPTDNNMISDPLFIKYIVGRLETYIKSQEEIIDNYKILLSNIKK